MFFSSFFFFVCRLLFEKQRFLLLLLLLILIICYALLSCVRVYSTRQFFFFFFKMDENETAPSLAEIHIAASHLRSISLPITPILTSSILNRLTGREIYLKCENFQRTGSFKSRGALNAVLNALKIDPNIKGFVTHSSGNHGQAVSYASSIVQRPCVVVVPQGTPKNKTDAIEHYGAELLFCGPMPNDRVEMCNKMSEERGFFIVPPYDHRDVIAGKSKTKENATDEKIFSSFHSGQGTIAVEFLEQVPNLDAILVPVSGGGLISGIALYAKRINPQIRIYACVPEGKMLEECLRTNERLWQNPPQFLSTRCECKKRKEKKKKKSTLIDFSRSFSACRLQQCGQLTFPIMCSLIEKEVFVIPESMMINATRFAFERLKLVVELAAGLSLGAILSQSERLDKNIRNVGVILCGGNIDLSLPLPWLED